MLSVYLSGGNCQQADVGLRAIYMKAGVVWEKEIDESIASGSGL